MKIRVLRNDPREFKLFNGRVIDKKDVCIRLTKDDRKLPYFSTFRTSHINLDFKKLKYYDLYEKHDIGGIGETAYNRISELAKMPEFNFGESVIIDSDEDYPITVFNKYIFIAPNGRKYFTIVGGNINNLIPFEPGETNQYASYIDLDTCVAPVTMFISSNKCKHMNTTHIIRGSEQYNSRKAEYQLICKDCGKMLFFNKNTIETIHTLNRILKLVDKIDNPELHRILLNQGMNSRYLSMDKNINKLKDNETERDFIERLSEKLADYTSAPKAINKW